jgi:hypothetical protein
VKKTSRGYTELGKRLDQIRAGVERIRECTLEQLAEESSLTRAPLQEA